MSSKSAPSLATSSKSPRTVFESLCARAIVFVFLPYAGKRAPDSQSGSRTVTKPQNSENRSSETSTESTMTALLPGWETTKRYAANCTLALKAVVLGCGPLFVTAACVVFLRAVGGGAAGNSGRPLSNSRGEAQQRLSEQAEHEHQEHLQQYISSISYRQRRIKRNLLCASQLDSVSQLVSCRVADAKGGSMACTTGAPTSTSAFASVDDRCAICLESNSSGGGQVRILACSHAFHAPCIDPWLTTCCGICPLCKTQLQPTKH